MFNVLTKTVSKVFLIGSFMLLISCSSQQTEPSPKPKPVSPLPSENISIISGISVEADRSYKEFFENDPYDQLSKLTIDVHKPNRELYNYLFAAVKDIKESVDISHFSLSMEEVIHTSESLYEQAGLQFFYLKWMRWSEDFHTVYFTYSEKDPTVIKSKQAVFYTHMNYLLNNIAPQHYTPLQTFFTVYEYITKHTHYSENIEDPTTHHGFSLLVDNQAICNGYAILVYDVLNKLGIPTNYLSNEPHAWNTVELNGVTYHTDFTWGAGYNYDSYLNTILMNDEARMEGLENAGFGSFPIIEGYMRDHPTEPEPITDSRYSIFHNIYQSYTMDVRNQWLYYSDSEKIYRVRFDGSGQEIILEEPATSLAYYHDSLYYSGYELNKLYQLVPGEEPILLDDTINIFSMKIVDGILFYGGYDDESQKNIDLNEFSLEAFPENSTKPISEFRVPRESTFSVQITFNEKMDTTHLPKDKIGLLSEEAKTIPLHLNWNSDGTTLTIRSQKLLLEEKRLSLYVLPGLITDSGETSKDEKQITIYLD
jgi:hypothetical protein